MLVGVCAIYGVLILKTYPTQVICLAVAGLTVSVHFILFQAPDIALTQLLIELLLMIFILMLLQSLPPAEVVHKPLLSKLWRIGVSVAFGGLMAVLMLYISAEPTTYRLGDHFLMHSTGNNVVNSILVDFRGFDTMGEVTVLLITLLGGYVLLSNRRAAL
jgi:multisubunit Na+/H+ antiporter MnhB subunit